MLVSLSMGAVLALYGCRDGSSPAEVDDGESIAEALRGDGQIAAPQTELPGPLTIRLASRSGRARRGVDVSWSASDGGSVNPERAVTDDSGMARTFWTLGPGMGSHAASARVGTSEVRFLARAMPLLPLGEIRTLGVSPAIGGSEFVHPDVVKVPRGWGNGRRFLAITPYPGGDVREELPSIFASGVMTDWAAPPGLTNPVLQRPKKGYLSDPDIVFEPVRRELWMYYRQVTSKNTILLTTSTDGSHWSAPLTVASAPNHMIVSPSVVRVGDGDWHMWSVNSGVEGCTSLSTVVEHRTSTDGILWSEPRPTSFTDATMPAWHIDVEWIPEFSQFWALYNGKSGANCTTPALYIASSADGQEWHTLPNAVLWQGAIPDFQDIVYRASLEYEQRSDVVTLWYSGARYVDSTWIWRAAVERRPREDLFVEHRIPRALRPGTGRSLAPPLLRAP